MIISGLIDALGLFNSLTVTPEVMQAKAETVQTKIIEVQNAFENIKNLVNKTEGYWIGEAGDMHRTEYKAKEGDITMDIANLKEEVSDLIAMASVYSSTEKEVSALAADLPNDVII